jgi:hypothetical protein
MASKWTVLSVALVSVFFPLSNTSQTPAKSGPKCADLLQGKNAAAKPGFPAGIIGLKDSSHFQIAKIQFSQTNLNAHYVLYSGKDAPTYEGNDPAELIRRLNASSPVRGEGSYYIAFVGFEPHRAENLANSLKLQLNSLDSSISMKPILGDFEEWSGVMLRPVVDVIGEPQIRPLEGREGWFEGTQQIEQRANTGLHRVTLRAQSKSRSIIRRFFDIFGSRVNAEKHPPSVAEIVSAARAELKKQLDFNDAEFSAFVADQTGRSFIARELILTDYVG